MALRNSSRAVVALASLCGASIVQADAPSEADSKPIDTILVTAKGYANLTNVPKVLILR